MASLVKRISIFLEMIKFEHSIFALPFAYLGLFLAEEGRPDAGLLVWVTLAMVSFRTLGMTLNRLIDRQIDSRNPRTASRALPAGKLKVSFAWTAAFLSFLTFEYSAYVLGPLCFMLSPVPVLLALLYPWAKRFTWLSHLLLGMILGIAPYGAWIAASGSFSWVPGLIMLGVVCWVAGFDIIYALQDEPFDRREGLHSIPARFGIKTSLVLTQALHGLTLAAWLSAGWVAGLGWIYFLGILAVAVFLIREHWLVRSFGLERIGEAFFTLNAAVSMAVFAAVVGDFALKGIAAS